MNNKSNQYSYPYIVTFVRSNIIKSITIIKKNNIYNIKDNFIFYNFVIQMDVYGLGDTVRCPMRHDPIYTIICTICNNINMKKGVKCYKCDTKLQKKTF